MLEKLMPRSDDFFDDFEKQAAVTLEGTRLLQALLEKFNDIPAKVEEIKNAEHRGDEITHRMIARLHQQFITPFDRADMQRLMSRIDDVLDMTDAAAERIAIYELPTGNEDAKKLADTLVAAAEVMQKAVAGLRHIKKPEQILAACEEINRLENQADSFLRAGLGRLFKSGADPLTVIKWKEILDLIESATDRCEDVANVIEGVVLEHG